MLRVHGRCGRTYGTTAVGKVASREDSAHRGMAYVVPGTGGRIVVAAESANGEGNACGGKGAAEEVGVGLLHGVVSRGIPSSGGPAADPGVDAGGALPGNGSLNALVDPTLFVGTAMLPVVPGTFVVGLREEVPLGHEISIVTRGDAQVAQIHRVAVVGRSNEQDTIGIAHTDDADTVLIEVVEQCRGGKHGAVWLNENVKRQACRVAAVVLGHDAPP